MRKRYGGSGIESGGVGGRSREVMEEKEGLGEEEVWR